MSSLIIYVFVYLFKNSVVLFHVPEEVPCTCTWKIVFKHNEVAIRLSKNLVTTLDTFFSFLLSTLCAYLKNLVVKYFIISIISKFRVVTFKSWVEFQNYGFRWSTYEVVACTVSNTVFFLQLNVMTITNIRLGLIWLFLFHISTSVE